VYRVRLTGREVEVGVRVSGRARRATLLVGPRQPPVVVIPAGTPESEVTGLLRRHAGWLERRLAAIDERAARAPVLGLDREGWAWIDGRPLRIEHGGAGPSVARLAGETIRVTGAAGRAPAAVERLMRREARRRLAASAQSEAARLGLSYRSLSVRDQRTRWGSCSPAGHLSFSWRLVMVPSEVRDHIVVHELCHLRVPSHSGDFWSMLDGARPGWRDQGRWLDEHGDEVLAYRVRLPAFPRVVDDANNDAIVEYANN
jgi:predicted metal-dependent hydrolase